MSIDLNKIKKVYFIGIKGVAMSGLAVICKQRGLEVTGSDVSERFITDKILEDAGINSLENFDTTNLDFNPDLVVVGASWGDENIEVEEVKKRGLNIISDSKFRGLLSQEKRTIAITGVHGKTTTTALMSYLFTKAGEDPSFLVGTGLVADLPSNSAWARGQHFIVEGDEYIGDRENNLPKFLDLESSISVITSIEWEHVDIYKSLESIEEVFARLVSQTKDLVVACGDWPSVLRITKDSDKVITYGTGDQNDYQAYDIIQGFDGTTFKVKNKDQYIEEFAIKIFGLHNVVNALAVIVVGLKEGISPGRIKQILSGFKGAERRFDVSQRDGITFIDDYGHHPTAIKTTLQAVRHRYPDKKIWCVFQPHMVSRTKALEKDFAVSFSDADTILVADIFASARESSQDYTSRQLAEEIKKNHNDVVYVGDLNETLDYLKDKIKPDMVLVTMGAGDVYRVRDKLLK